MCINKFKKEKKFNVSVSSFVTYAFIIIFTNPLPNEGYEDLALLLLLTHFSRVRLYAAS